MQRTTWLHCAEPRAAANAAAAALALFDGALLSGQADAVDEEHGSQIIKRLLSTGGTSVSSGEHIVDQLCSRIATSSAAVTAMYNDPPSSPELPYWSACASVCQWFVRTVIQCHLCPPPAGACPSPPFLLPTSPAAHINMPACVKVSLLSFIQNCNSLCLPHRNPHPSAAMQALVAHVIAVARCRSQSHTSKPCMRHLYQLRNYDPKSCAAFVSPSSPFTWLILRQVFLLLQRCRSYLHWLKTSSSRFNFLIYSAANQRHFTRLALTLFVAPRNAPPPPPASRYPPTLGIAASAGSPATPFSTPTSAASAAITSWCMPRSTTRRATPWATRTWRRSA